MSALVASGGHGADAGAQTPARLAKLRAFHTLDALRGVAAIAVLLFHAGFFYGIVPPAEGYLAVDLFFVMSGFIIAYRYEEDFRAGLGVGGFLKVRLIRLYPLFLLGTVLALIPALAAFTSGQGNALYRGVVEAFPPALLMLPSRTALPYLPEVYPLNYVSWSLALEIIVNVAYAASFRIWTARRLALLLVVSALGLAAAAAAYGSLNVGYDWANILGGPPRILYGFGAGVLIFRFWENGLPRPRLPWWTLLVVALAVAFFDPRVLGTGWARPAWDVLMVTFVVPAIVVAAIANEPPPLARGACAMTGVLSYVLYSLHAPFVGFFLRGEARLHLDVGTISPGRTLAFTGLLAALCVVAHLAYDKPIRRMLSSRPTARRPIKGPPLYPSSRGGEGEPGIHDNAAAEQGVPPPPAIAWSWVPGSRFARPGKTSRQMAREPL